MKTQNIKKFINAEDELIKDLSEQLARQIDQEIIKDLVFLGKENEIDIIIRDCRIDEILYDKSFTNQDILDKVMKNSNINININPDILNRLRDYIREKRGS